MDNKGPIEKTKKLWGAIEDQLLSIKEYPDHYDIDCLEITRLKGSIFRSVFGDCYFPKPMHNCFLCEQARYSQPRKDGMNFIFGKTCRHCTYYKKHGHLCTTLGYNEDDFTEQVLEELLFFCDTIKSL